MTFLRKGVLGRLALVIELLEKSILLILVVLEYSVPRADYFGEGRGKDCGYVFENIKMTPITPPVRHRNQKAMIERRLSILKFVRPG
jgi:hypothetical protein